MQRHFLRHSWVALAAATGLACASTGFAGEAPPAAPPKPYNIPAGTADYIVKAVQSAAKKLA